MNNNYYKDLWTKQNSHGDIFWKNVDFNKPEYINQELVFRNFLQGLKRLSEASNDGSDIRTVLEVGAGTGRMTKIVLEELPTIKRYVVDEIRDKSQFFIDNKDIEYYQSDLTSLKTPLPSSPGYDLILLSEVLMHIKPEDISPVISKLVKLLAPNHGKIINIDWALDDKWLQNSDWCFLHDYDKLYTENGLHPIYMTSMNVTSINKQKLFCYGA